MQTGVVYLCGGIYASLQHVKFLGSLTFKYGKRKLSYCVKLTWSNAGYISTSSESKSLSNRSFPVRQILSPIQFGNLMQQPFGNYGQTTDFVQSRNTQQIRQTNGFYVSDTNNRRVDIVDRAPTTMSEQFQQGLSGGEDAMYIGCNNDIKSGQYGDFIDNTQEEAAFYSQHDQMPVGNRISSATLTSQAIENNGDFNGSNKSFGQTYAGQMNNSNTINNTIESNDMQSARWPLTRYRLQQDHNPIVVRRASKDSTLTYQQNIHVRFLKPPVLPAPGPLIIKEIRPPQIAPAPPLIIRQRPVLTPALPPIVLREMPPKAPIIPGAEIITRKLPALPPPPRQIIVERYPPLPPKPRDVIIERWLPYDPVARRRVIHQRAVVKDLYKAKKNVIIHYERPSVQYMRNFNKYGVYVVDPKSYVARYGDSLLDRWSVLENAKKLGVYEDINNPALTTKTSSTRAHAEEIQLNNRNVNEVYSTNQGTNLNIDKNAFSHSYESLSFPKSDGTNSWAKIANASSGDDTDEIYNRKDLNMNIEQELYNEEADNVGWGCSKGGYEDATYIDNLVNSVYRDDTNRYVRHLPAACSGNVNRNSSRTKYGDIFNGGVSSNYDSGFYADGTDIEKSLQTDWIYGASGNCCMNEMDSSFTKVPIEKTVPSADRSIVTGQVIQNSQEHNVPSAGGFNEHDQYLMSNMSAARIHETCEEATYTEEIKVNSRRNFKC